MPKGLFNINKMKPIWIFFIGLSIGVLIMIAIYVPRITKWKMDVVHYSNEMDIIEHTINDIQNKLFELKFKQNLPTSDTVMINNFMVEYFGKSDTAYCIDLSMPIDIQVLKMAYAREGIKEKQLADSGFWIPTYYDKLLDSVIEIRTKIIESELDRLE